VEAAPLSGAASPSRATVERRPFVRPALWPNDQDGYPQNHPYVLRFWTPAVGPGAVTDLLRLMTAARRGLSLRQPLHLAELARAGLVCFADGQVWVRDTVPVLPPDQVRRLPPALRREHRLEYWQPPDGREYQGAIRPSGPQPLRGEPNQAAGRSRIGSGASALEGS
jgi:hypothetical protein